MGTTIGWVQLPYCFQANSGSCKFRQFVTVTLPHNEKDAKVPDPNLFNTQQIETLLVTSAQLKTATNQDPILSRVLRYTKRGWPTEVSDTLKPYWNRRSELSIEDDCIL